MAKLNLRSKIVIPSAVMITLLSAAVTVFSVGQFASFSDYMLDERLETAASGIRGLGDDIRRMALEAGIAISHDAEFVDAVARMDTPGILARGARLVEQHGLTSITVAHISGVVLARTDVPENYGDPMPVAMFQDGVFLMFSPTGIRHVPIRVGVPIRHGNEQIGLMLATYALDTQEAVEAIAARFNADVTILGTGDEALVRLATTLLDESGNSMAGTRLTDPGSISAVESRRETLAQTEYAGAGYSVVYMPLDAPDGTPFGTVVIGVPTDHVDSRAQFIMAGLAGMGLAGLVVSSLVIIAISGRIVAPVKRLQAAMSELSMGRLNFNREQNLPSDEIGDLMQRAYAFADVVADIVGDIGKLTHEVSGNGDIDYRIDASAYEGSFREAIEGLNSFTEDFVKDMLIVLTAVRGMAEGEFKADMKRLPGKKAVLNETVDALSANLRSVSGEVGAIVQTMIEAKAAAGTNEIVMFSIDAEKYSGEWKKIMEGLNRVATGVYGPVGEIMKAMNRLGEGRLDMRIDGDYSGVFLEIKRAVNRSMDNLDRMVRSVSGTLRAVAQGDLTVRFDEEFSGDFAEIEESVDMIVDKLNSTLAEIKESVERVLAGSSNISQSAKGLAVGASQQAAAVEELTSSASMLNERTRGNADSADAAMDLCARSVANAKEGSGAVLQVRETVGRIKESGSKISQVNKTIQDIAFQTNLLALNASVEAARAGEHGKGFSVVAEEVRTLAARSHASATETATFVDESLEHVNTSSQRATVAEAALEVIVGNAEEVARVIGDIAESSKGQADAISQLSLGIGQIISVVHDNSAVSEESAMAAEELCSQAEILNEMVGYFKLRKPGAAGAR